MSEDKDDRLAELLSAAAPPARDPVFRIKVLERREQRQFQRRSFTILAGALAILLLSMFSLDFEGGALTATGALVVVAALVSTYLAFRRHLPRILRRFSL